VVESVGGNYKKHKMYPWGIDPAGGRRKMKKYALVALFAVVSLGMVFAVAASPSTGTVSIQGSVDQYFQLTVPATYTGSISYDSSTHWDLSDMKVISNVKNWVLTVSSQNNGVLKDTANGADIAYKVTVGNLLNKQQLTTAGIKSSGQAKTPKAGTAYKFAIDIDAPSELYQAGTYSDVITLTISNN
jgi:hypothetical protein